MDTNL